LKDHKTWGIFDLFGSFLLGNSLVFLVDEALAAAAVGRYPIH
jgi:hypothetical protein